MLNSIQITSVPREEVIMPASWLLDNPKSATLATQAPFFFCHENIQ
jgi:hypothetical protein